MLLYITCPKCQKEAINAHYCSNCGTSLVVPICNWCGEPLWDHFVYCKGCGRTREEATTNSPISALLTFLGNFFIKKHAKS